MNCPLVESTVKLIASAGIGLDRQTTFLALWVGGNFHFPAGRGGNGCPRYHGRCRGENRSDGTRADHEVVEPTRLFFDGAVVPVIFEEDGVDRVFVPGAVPIEICAGGFEAASSTHNSNWPSLFPELFNFTRRIPRKPIGRTLAC